MRQAFPSVSAFLLSLLLALFPGAGGSAYAQHTTGELQFKVVDSLGNAIPGVNALVTGPSVLGTRGGVSDPLGYVNIPALQPGRITVRVSHSAFQGVVFESVPIRLGKTTSLGEVVLRDRMHELAELVISSGRAVLIDPRITHSGASLRATEIEGLPVERNYRSIAALLPQANTSYFGDEVNVAGATGAENKYFVDGVDVTDSFLGFTGTNLPYNFVNEIEVREGGYEAEYSSALGGIINVITPSGGNEYHGSVSGFFTSNRFTAHKQAGLLDRTQGGFSNYDAGFGIGGPLIRDELWFYGAYNPKIEQSDVPVPDFGTALDRSITHSFAGKLTWRASQRVQIVLMTTGDPTEWHAVGEGISPAGLANPDPFFSDQKHGGINMSVRGTYASENGFLLEASVSRTTQKGVWQGATDRGRNEVLFIDAETGIWSGGLGFFVDRFISSNTYSVSGTFTTGPHIFKGGIQYKAAGVNENDGGKRYIRYSDTSYELQQDRAFMNVGDRIPSLYIQDSWRIAEGLRLNLGLRWDAQLIIASDGTMAQKFTGEYQPRVGITVLPDESQKLYASFGRFYQELSSVIAENYTNQRYSIDVFYNHDPRIDPTNPARSFIDSATIRPAVEGLRGIFFDEFNLGYERALGGNLKIGIQGVYRTLREAVQDMYLSSSGTYVLGNPGSGVLSEFPKARRDYTALVLSLQGHVGDRGNVLASYVLSRNYGNYPGFFDAYSGYVNPIGNGTFDFNNDSRIMMGLLPNDRTHVFKCAGSYRLGSGLTAGASFLWQSGTPLTEYAWGGVILSPRGTAGRTQPSGI